MLVNSRELLREYRRRGRCLPAFNIYNLETIRAALTAARQEETPVILAFGEGYLSHASFKTIAVLAAQLAEEHPLPVVLHLDHCRDPRHIQEAVEAGFTSVMYDGTGLPLEENIRQTRAVVEFARGRDVTVEGELGGMNPEDGTGGEEDLLFTDPSQARIYTAESGVDSLAVSVGNVHGVYRGEPRLDLDRLAAVYQAAEVPLVLHGCSGIPHGDIRRAAELAVAKINVNTEIAMGAAGRVSRELNAGIKRYEKLAAAAEKEMTGIMGDFLRLSK